MIRLHRVALLLAATLLFTPPALAQFETPNRQFHDQTTFRLEGRHLAVPCESCHLKGVYKATPAKCVNCHWERRQDDRFRLQLGSQCEQCHRPIAWTAVRFDHGATTGMPLNGAHRELACQSCHKNDNLRAAQNTCVSCHQQDYQNARTPNHVVAGFPTACEACHRPSDVTFQGARFDHQASFPLVGQHAQLACASCHRPNVYRGTARDCVGCHREAYNRTTSPNHLAAGFPMTCESCHRATDVSFRGVNFNHGAVFPLIGQHAQATCASCHRDNVFRGTPRECIGCHQDNYNRTTSPNHAAAGFPTTCENCHRPSDTSFRGAGFNHAQVFALVGRHAQTVCTSCHRNNVFRGTPRDCAGCHQDAYSATTTPNHAAAGFSTACETCHRPTDTSFRGAGFNHAQVFALVGRHAATACTSCHRNNVFRGTPRDCVGCHQDAYNATTTPNHAAAGFSTACETCHRPTDTSFRGAGFNHASVFPLQGVHAQQACTSCHRNNVYRGTSRDCVGCHRTNYDRTTTPNHAAAGFPTTCESCHRATDTTWRQGTFNHRFPITSGPHRTGCTTCHQTGSFRVFTCLVCHEHRQSAMDDKHRNRAGYRYDSLACVSCHPNGRH